MHGVSIDCGGSVSDTYDALVMSGGMGEGHIPTAALIELIRVVKPGTNFVINI